MGVVFHERDVHPRSIVLYPEMGQMFFTNEKPEKKSIVRATMAGADKTLFSAASPGDLAVDKARNRLYWTDTTMKRIEYADLTGMNRATLIETNVLQPVGLAVHGSYVYWIDRESRNVMKIREDDVRGRTVQAAIDDLSDMIVVDTLKTSVHHPCFMKRCSHICSVGVHGHAQCSCPMDMILADNNSTCRAPKTCKPEQFTCSSGQCIPQGWICDDSEDCKDGSDEQNCTKCPKGEVRCDGGKCISVTKLCDGNNDCEDGSDEKQDNCPLKCADDEFPCVTVCITKDWVCDNHDDCGDNADEIDCDVISKNATVPRVTPFKHSNLSGKMVGVIVASIIVCGIFLTVAVLMCRRLKHGPDCNVAHEIGLVVTPVLHPRPRSSASSSSASSHRNVFQLHRKGPGSVGSSHKHSKSNGTAPSLSNRSSTTQTAYDRNHLTGASCSSTASTVVTAYFHEPLNPPPSPVTERSHFTSRSRPYCESLIAPSSSASHRHYRPRMPPPPTPASTDVESVISRHRGRRAHRCRYQRYTQSSCTELAYDSDPFAPPPTPNTNYMSEATHFSDQEGPPPSPAMTERSYHPHPYPPPPSPVTDAPSVVL